MAAALVAAFLLPACGRSDDLLVGVATSVQDSGLMDELVSGFDAAYPDAGGVKVVPGGSGQLLEMARRGELDVVITHSPQAEERLVTDGDGIDPRPFMHNFFLLVGPADDPAGVRGADSLAEAFRRIADAKATFVSRGDDSGTNVRELALWRELGIDPRGKRWYVESGVGQGPNLQVASGKGAYTLTDSSTWLEFRERLEMEEYVTDTATPNLYSVTRVNPERHDVNGDAARAFAEFLTSAAGREIIATFGQDEFGRALFVPEAAAAPVATP